MNDESVVNMASKCANNYYCTYYEKCVSSNKKYIDDHNNKDYRKIHIYSNVFA
jgi:hypothetical protein